MARPPAHPCRDGAQGTGGAVDRGTRPDDAERRRILRASSNLRGSLVGMSYPISLRRNVATRSWRQRLTRCTRRDGDRSNAPREGIEGPLFTALELSGFWRGICSCQTFPNADLSANGASEIRELHRFTSARRQCCRSLSASSCRSVPSDAQFLHRCRHLPSAGRVSAI